MHELSIAQNMLETLEPVAKEHGARKVTTVTLKLGELTCVEPESLTFAFEVVCAGTVLEGCRLDIIRVPLTVTCETFSWQGETHIDDTVCPSCGGVSFAVTGGREIQLQSIDIEEQTEDEIHA